MRIKKHEKSYIIELEDGSTWRIWPGDLAIPLLWMPSTRLAVSEINGECWARLDRSFARNMRPRDRSSGGMGSREDRSIAGKLTE